MYGFRITRTGAAAFVGLLLLPIGVSAQTGSIAGSVVDETGGVLPGVTVEAASPAAIEGVRSAVTDGSGLYGIEALRPGTYTVTFILPGFSTFVREGIELTSGFTANVDARMAVGAIEETVTVSGASPVIDVQNVVSQENLSREQLDTLPTNKTYFSYAALTVGMNTLVSGGGHDVGGTIGDAFGHVGIHGSSGSDGELNWDGMSFNNNIGDGGGGSKQFYMNQAAIQEIVVSTSNMDAETAFGGVGINAIPKEGGNTFSYYVSVSGTNGNFQNDNVDDALQARGASPLAKNKKVWDYGVGVGGPIVRDRVWFYTAHRWWGAQNFQPTGNFNMTPHTPFYTPDPDRPAWLDGYNQDNSIRFTVQASQKHKLTLSQNFQRSCQCHFWTQWSIADMDAAVDYTYWPINLTQTTWTFPASNRLLFEAGGSFLRNLTSPRPQEQVRPTDVAHVTFIPFFNWQSFGINPCAPCLYGLKHNFPTYVFRGSVSYVTGTHAFKAGFNTRHAEENHGRSFLTNPYRYDFLNPDLALQVTQFATPRTSNQSSNELGFYAQDQWTINRLTLNLGVRFDHLNAYVPEQTHPEGNPYVPSFSIGRIDNVPNYKDISPRLGASYDLFGDGRTAIKGTLGKYVLAVGTSIAQIVNPMEAIAVATSRPWNDAPFPLFGLPAGNGNRVPDCELANFGANGECGAVRNPEFGTPAITQRFDPDLLEGWGIREYQWQGSVSIQHELFEGWSVEVGYFRTQFGNFRVVDNLNIGPEDFSEFSIAAPVDPRLGEYSGAELGGLYTITPEGQAKGTNNFVTLSGNIPGGDQMRQIFNGIDLTFNGRLENGITLGGGVSTGATAFDECFVIDSPMQARPGYCNVSEPWSAGTQVKLNGAIPLPYDTQVAFVFQNLAGRPWESIYQAGAGPAERAAAEAQMGHPFVAGMEEIQLFPAGAGSDLNGNANNGGGDFNFTGSQFYEPRLTQLDLRLTKIFQFGGARFRGSFDIYNIFNANSVSALGSNYSPDAYPLVAQIMGGRILRFGGQFDF